MKSELIETVIIVAALVGIFVIIFAKSAEVAEATTPEQFTYRELCLGSGNHARPACWRESDWEAYCARVECKR